MITDILLSLSLIAMIVFGTRVFAEAGDSRAARYFGLYCFVASFITLVEIMTHYAPSEQVARGWGQLAAVWPLAWVFFTQFSMASAHDLRHRRLLIGLTYAAATVIAVSYAILARSGAVVVPAPDYGFVLQSPFVRTPLGFAVAGGYICILVITVGVLLGAALKSNESSRRRQVIWISIAFGLGFSSGVGLVLLREVFGLSVREVNGFSYIITAGVIYLGIVRKHLVHLTPELVARQALDQIGELFVLTDESYSIVTMNSAAERTLGTPRRNLIGVDFRELMGAPSEVPLSGDFVLPESEEPTVLSVSETTTTNHLGEVVGRVFIGRDTTDAHRREERLNTLLTEKNVVVQELHHRVRNTLQLIDGLLSLKTARIEDPDALEMLSEVADRIHVIASVYNDVYAHGELHLIPLDRALYDLCARQTSSVSPVSRAAVKLEIDVEPAEISADRAIPLLIAVAELVANSRQHAYLPGHDGIVRVESREQSDGRWSVVVSDDGSGLQSPPPPGAAGLLLARELASQIDGTLEQVDGCGTTWRLSFPRS